MTALLCIGTLSACRRNAAETATPVSSNESVSLLVKEFSSKPNFEVIEVGKLGFSIVKALVRKSNDEDAMQLLDAIDKVTRVTVTEYDSCEEDVKQEFVSRLNGMLDEDMLLFEARGSGEKLQVYGQASEDGASVSDLLINIPSSGTLVSIKGIIPMDKVSEIAEKSMR